MQQTITLGKLAFSCYIFDKIDSGAYGKFLEQTNHSPDLSNKEHCLVLLKWLNDWGIRSIAKEDYERLSKNIKSWYDSNELFDKDQNLQDLSEDDLAFVEAAYSTLVRIRSLGPTSSAKILFAARPKALVAWDETIREAYVGPKGSYVEFLKKVKSVIGTLECECKKYGFKPEKLPEKLGRPEATLPKLIDEYNWITITKGCPLPDRQTLERWAGWSN
jgi:hypothetical protein